MIDFTTRLTSSTQKFWLRVAQTRRSALAAPEGVFANADLGTHMQGATISTVNLQTPKECQIVIQHCSFRKLTKAVSQFTSMMRTTESLPTQKLLAKELWLLPPLELRWNLAAL